MRKIMFTIFSSLIISQLNGQDSLYIKRKLTTNEISVLFSAYTQDGNHSAVTGGKGTEKLQVYAPQVSYSLEKDSVYTIFFDAGIDFITSASTDRIDFNMSSASYHDANYQVSGGYSRYFRKPRLEARLAGSYSVESDYMSYGINLSFFQTSANLQASYYLGFQVFFDDQRWGRNLYPLDLTPETLIYPAELRDTNWFDVYMRYSYNLSMGYERVINKRMMVGIYPGLTIQTGLLSTPFHRVYFREQDEARVENLPTYRIKVPVGVKFNVFIGSGIILNSFYRFYADDFGIAAHVAEAETFYKISPVFAPSLSFRYYTQTGSKYFKPYKEHSLSEEYYTSDYDLSRFFSLEAGAGVRFAPLKKISKNWNFGEIDLRYSFYWRSDGLKAHFISLGFKVQGAQLK